MIYMVLFVLREYENPRTKKQKILRDIGSALSTTCNQLLASISKPTPTQSTVTHGAPDIKRTSFVQNTFESAAIAVHRPVITFFFNFAVFLIYAEKGAIQNVPYSEHNIRGFFMALSNFAIDS